MSDRPKLSMEELLLRHGTISAEQLQRAREEQQRTGKDLADLLVELGYVDTLTAELVKHPQFAAIHARLERLEQLTHNEVNAVKALTEMLIDKGVIDREEFFIKISKH